jgi:hypothetical protein
MSQTRIVARSPEQDLQLRNEALGDWYNYEPKDAAPQSLQADRWLDPWDEYLRRSSSLPRA